MKTTENYIINTQYPEAEDMSDTLRVKHILFHYVLSETGEEDFERLWASKHRGNRWRDCCQLIHSYGAWRVDHDDHLGGIIFAAKTMEAGERVAKVIPIALRLIADYEYERYEYPQIIAAELAALEGRTIQEHVYKLNDH